MLNLNLRNTPFERARVPHGSEKMSFSIEDTADLTENAIGKGISFTFALQLDLWCSPQFG